MRRRKSFLQGERQRRLGSLRDRIRDLRQFVRSDDNNSNDSEVSTAADSGAVSELKKLRNQLEAAVKAAQAAASEADGQRKQQTVAMIQRVVVDTAGLNAVASSIQRSLANGQQNPALKSEFDVQRGTHRQF